jgi:2-C-methyl-D-erythritol 2,4-cyclodiphosphate synthase
VFRIGVGYDSHRTVEGRRLVLGGEHVPSTVGLKGHSDGDALCHAVADALLGAAGRGDIGEWFSPDDAAYRGAYSLALLGQVAGRLRDDGWRVVNVDTVLVAQEPRLAAYREGIRASLAGALGVAVDRVNVKATAPERVGSLGRADALVALATALVERE